MVFYCITLQALNGCDFYWIKKACITVYVIRYTHFQSSQSFSIISIHRLFEWVALITVHWSSVLGRPDLNAAMLAGHYMSKINLPHNSF